MRNFPEKLQHERERERKYLSDRNLQLAENPKANISKLLWLQETARILRGNKTTQEVLPCAFFRLFSCSIYSKYIDSHVIVFHVKVELHDQFDTFSFLMVQLRMHSEILTFMIEYSNKFRIH